MADIKIPQLGAAVGITDTDLIIVDDGTNTLKASGAQVRAYTSKKVKAEIAPDWETGQNYKKFDIRNYNDKIYECKEDNLSSSSLTPLNSTYWSETNIGEKLSATGERVVGTFMSDVSIQNQGAETTLCQIQLTKGRWLIFYRGYAPINKRTFEPITTIKAIDITTQKEVFVGTLLYAMTLCGTLDVANNSETINLSIVSWEDQVYQARTPYQFYAIKIRS